MRRHPLARRFASLVASSVASGVAAASLLGGALSLAALAAGCGQAPPTVIGNPKAFVGSYAVTIAAAGKTDDDEMSASLGSSSSVLLTFVYGFSEIRATPGGSTMLTMPAQMVDVEHSTGEFDGLATGSGTIKSDGNVDIMLKVESPNGFADPDGGTDDTRTFHITGSRQMTM